MALESILGFELHGNRTRFRPCLPANWQGYQLTLHRDKSTGKFTITRESLVDSQPIHSSGNVAAKRSADFVEIELPKTDGIHKLAVKIGERDPAAPSTVLIGTRVFQRQSGST